MKHLKRFEDVEWDKEDEERAKKNAMSEFAHLQKAEAEKKEKRYQRSYKEDPDGMYPRDDEKYDKPHQDDPEYRDWYLANHSESVEIVKKGANHKLDYEDNFDDPNAIEFNVHVTSDDKDRWISVPYDVFLDHIKKTDGGKLSQYIENAKLDDFSEIFGDLQELGFDFGKALQDYASSLPDEIVDDIYGEYEDFEDYEGGDEVDCPDCDGDGVDSEGDECERCDGSGQVFRPDDIPPNDL